MKTKVYIAGPISKGDLAHNIRQAETAFFALLRSGFAPFCPHWSVYSTGPKTHKRPFGQGDLVWAEATNNGGGGANHADWLGVDLPWVAASEAVLRLPGESTGADMEVACAREHGIPVFFDINDLLAYFGIDLLGPGPAADLLTPLEAAPEGSDAKDPFAN